MQKGGGAPNNEDRQRESIIAKSQFDPTHT